MKNEMQIDLARLAVLRCRDAFMTVGQLVEGDVDRGSLAVTVAADLIVGAITMLKADRRFRKKCDHELIDHILGQLNEALHTEAKARDPRQAKAVFKQLR
jgi:hypothetical protein